MSTSTTRTSTNRVQAHATAQTAPARGPELLRRVLLGLVLALIVARPLVPGEDIGLVQALSGASGLFLALGWLLLAVGWAGWRCWTGKAVWYGSWVEVGLCLVLVAVVASTLGGARYQHPGWVSLGEWFALVIAFCLVRQLAIGPSETRRLALALAAIAVALAGQAVFERVFAAHKPAVLGRVTAPKVVDLLSRQGFFVSEDDPTLQPRVEQLRDKSVSATYQQPAAFAGLLILTLPLLVGWTIAAGRRQPWAWPMWAGIVATALTATALCLTHAWVVIAAFAAAGIAAIGIIFARALWRRRLWLLAALLALGGLAFLFCRSVTGQKLLTAADHFWSGRLDAWAATWAMIKAHFWLGVGPGNFDRVYPLHLTGSGPKLELPYNFALELWSTCGLLALVGIAIAIGAFFLRAWRTRYAAMPASETESQPQTGVPWEFYLGAMLGLCVGIFLWALDQPEIDADAFKWGGFVAAGRSLLFFLAFALFDTVPWSGRGLARALTVGVAALFLAFIVSDGISFPALAQPLWIAAALALTVWSPGSPTWTSTARPRVFLPMPALAAICGCYVLAVLAPITGSWWQVRDVHAIAQFRHGSSKVRQGYGWADRRTLDAMLAELRKAIDTDPGNVLPRLEYAGWAELGLSQFRSRPQWAKNALSMTGEIQKLDPQNKAGYLAEAALYLIGAKQTRTDRRPFFKKAADALEKAAKLDPSNKRLQALWRDVTARSTRKPVRIPRSVIPPWPGARPRPTRPLPPNKR
jgi:hypothetical protein